MKKQAVKGETRRVVFEKEVGGAKVVGGSCWRKLLAEVVGGRSCLQKAVEKKCC